MPKSEQQEPNIEVSSDGTDEIVYGQTELYPGLRQSEFWPGAKYIQFGRVGLYHSRVEIKKAQEGRLEPEPTQVETFTSDRLF